MRNIKFRAWDIDNKEMILFTDDCNFCLSYEYGELCVSEIDKEGFPERVLYPVEKPREKYFDDCIIMQYIGLKDKHGVEIYEGDIIQEGEVDDIIWNGSAKCLKPAIGSIEWNYLGHDSKCEIEGKFKCIKDGKYYDKDCEFSLHLPRYDGEIQISNDIKIIGNIYENPELLEHKR